MGRRTCHPCISWKANSAPQIWLSLEPFSQSIRATSVNIAWLRLRVAVSNTWRSCERSGSDLLIGTMRLQAWPCLAAFGPNFNNDNTQRFLTEDQDDHKHRCIGVCSTQIKI